MFFKSLSIKIRNITYNGTSYAIISLLYMNQIFSLYEEKKARTLIRHFYKE